MKLLKNSLLFTLIPLLFVQNVYAKSIVLKDENWTLESKKKIESLLNKNAFKNKKVIFDFDNTTVSRDIGEATAAYMIKNNLIDKDLAKAISPSFTLEDKEISIDTVSDLSEYYEKLNEATNHKDDLAPYIVAYGWLVQIMQGRTVYDVVNATKNAYMDNMAINDRQNLSETKIEITEGKTYYRVPFFHNETVDLIGNLLENGYDIYFVSGSNSWTIRYMTTIELPKLLKKRFNKDLKIKPENVLGVNTLIKDKRTGKLYKDQFLVKENKKYADFDEEEIKNFELTNQLVSPLTGFDGKTINIMNYILKNGEKPFLILGDSAGDFSMLSFAENRIWFSRLESYDYQKKVLNIIKTHNPNSWIIQPVLYKKNAGLVKSQTQLKTLVDETNFDKYLKASKLFSDLKLLKW